MEQRVLKKKRVIRKIDLANVCIVTEKETKEDVAEQRIESVRDASDLVVRNGRTLADAIDAARREAIQEAMRNGLASRATSRIIDRIAEGPIAGVSSGESLLSRADLALADLTANGGELTADQTNRMSQMLAGEPSIVRQWDGPERPTRIRFEPRIWPVLRPNQEARLRPELRFTYEGTDYVCYDSPDGPIHIADAPDVAINLDTALTLRPIIRLGWPTFVPPDARVTPPAADLIDMQEVLRIAEQYNVPLATMGDAGERASEAVNALGPAVLGSAIDELSFMNPDYNYLRVNGDQPLTGRFSSRDPAMQEIRRVRTVDGYREPMVEVPLTTRRSVVEAEELCVFIKEGVFNNNENYIVNVERFNETTFLVRMVDLLERQSAFEVINGAAGTYCIYVRTYAASAFMRWLNDQRGSEEWMPMHIYARCQRLEQLQGRGNWYAPSR